MAADLEAEGLKTSRGSTTWKRYCLIKIIQNEKMCGDARLAKTVVADVLEKKRVKYSGQVQQVYITDDHEPIIARQTGLLNIPYRRAGYLLRKMAQSGELCAGERQGRYLLKVHN